MLWLIVGNLRRRWLEYGLATAAIALVVAVVIVQRAVSASTESTVHDLAHRLGKNMLLVPADTDLAAFWRHDLAGRTRGDALAAARGLLERLGLAARARHRPAELSVGERQRVAIGRSVVNSPRLVLADEPTGNLDPVTSASVVDLLLELAADGRAVVMVTHDPAIARLANRVVELSGGRVMGVRARLGAERVAS